MPDNFSMGVISSSSTLSTLICYENDFIAKDHNIVVIAPGQYISSCRRNAVSPSVIV